MKLKKYGKKMIVPVFILCVALAACSQREKEADKQQEAQTTEAVQENSENAENAGTVGPAGSSDAAGSETQGMIPVAKADFNGDGAEDSVYVKKIGESGMTKGLYVNLQGESEDLFFEVPEKITISCYQESKTEFEIVCGNLSLGTTTLAEEPAYGVLGKYMEKTLGMKKDGDRYDIEVNRDDFSLIDADNHNGSAFLCKGSLTVEEKLLDVVWTLEYSLGKWMLTSVELPLWNITGTTTGWETTRAEWSEMVKRNLYIGYLDESDSFQEVNSKQDFDGDGTIDRIWRDLSDGESYTVHFGNGEKFLITDDFNGSHIECEVWPMTEDKTAFWFLEAGMSTGGDWAKLHLFEQTEAGLVRMELPEGPTLRAEAATEREIAFYWKEQEPVGTLSLDSVDYFVGLTTEEWLDEYTSKENGAYIFRLTGYNTCSMMDGSVDERKAIRWNAYIGDKWGCVTFSWVTEYIDEAWETTDVFLP